MVPRNISSLAFMQGTFLFHRKYLVTLIHESYATSYERKKRFAKVLPSENDVKKIRIR